MKGERPSGGSNIKGCVGILPFFLSQATSGIPVSCTRVASRSPTSGAAPSRVRSCLVTFREPDDRDGGVLCSSFYPTSRTNCTPPAELNWQARWQTSSRNFSITGSLTLRKKKPPRSWLLFGALQGSGATFRTTSSVPSAWSWTSTIETTSLRSGPMAFIAGLSFSRSSRLSICSIRIPAAAFELCPGRTPSIVVTTMVTRCSTSYTALMATSSS